MPDDWTQGAREKMCGQGTYHDGVNVAFANATVGLGETLVTLQVLPSFEPEYALILKQAGSDLKLVRISFDEQLWGQFGRPARIQKTRQDCLDIAKTAKMNTTEVQASPQTIKQLWTTFNNINLTMKRLHFDSLDGTTYIVQTKDGRSLVLLNAEDKGFASENRALRTWVRSLLNTARNSQP
jgi:hypothetical protein